MDFKRPSILFLEGVFLSDIQNQNAFLDYLCDYSDDEFDYENNTIKYDRIPTEFYDKEDWPQTTNLKCWNCDRNFRNHPYFYPNRHEYKKGKVLIRPIGNYCSPFCVIPKILKLPKSEQWEKMELLRKAVLELDGLTLPIDIPCAPPKTDRLEYGGGYMTEVQYTEKINELWKYRNITTLEDLNPFNDI